MDKRNDRSIILNRLHMQCARARRGATHGCVLARPPATQANPSPGINHIAHAMASQVLLGLRRLFRELLGELLACLRARLAFGIH